MHYRFSTCGQLIIALLRVVLAQADYTIDDSNSTIQYAGHWTRDVLRWVDPTKLFYGTVTRKVPLLLYQIASLMQNHVDSTCQTQDGCYVTIPFIGTGITVYNMIRAQINISFAVDGGSSSAFVNQWDTRCFDERDTYDGCYNTSTYNVQSLTYAAHTLNITMLSYLGPNSFNSIITDFWFDCAVISSPTQSSFIPPSQRSHKSIAAAIGGTLGGIAAVMLAVLYYRKRGRWRWRMPVEINPEPGEPAFQRTMSITNPPRQVNTLHDWSPTTLLPDMDTQTSNIPLSPMPKSSIQSEATATAHIPTSSVLATLNTQNSSSSQSPQPAEAEAIARAFAAPTALTPTGPSSTRMSARLTEEQSDLVQGLLRHNVPLPTVVGAIEGMLRREGESGGGEGSASQITQSDGRLQDRPPEYDFV